VRKVRVIILFLKNEAHFFCGIAINHRKRLRVVTPARKATPIAPVSQESHGPTAPAASDRSAVHGDTRDESFDEEFFQPPETRYERLVTFKFNAKSIDLVSQLIIPYPKEQLNVPPPLALL